METGESVSGIGGRNGNGNKNRAIEHNTKVDSGRPALVNLNAERGADVGRV